MSFIILIESKVYCICLSVRGLFFLVQYPQDFYIVMHMTGFSFILKAKLGQIYITMHPFISWYGHFDYCIYHAYLGINNYKPSF